MELNGSNNCEQGSLVGELTKGMELTRQLQLHMGTDVTGEAKGMLVQGILSSYQNALSLLLNWGGSMEQSQHVVPSGNLPGSPISVIGSPKSEDLNLGFNAQQEGADFSRKRKTMSTWTKQVKGNLDNGLEGPPEDGYSWRKYGQKDILGAKHPRSYYRCTYRNQQGCCATKQVQRNDEDPSLFDVIYKGSHICTITPRSKSAPTSPEKREWNKHNSQFMIQQQPDALLNFQKTLSVQTQNLENQETGFSPSLKESGCQNHTFTASVLNDYTLFNSISPSFIPSPANSASNYVSTSPFNLSTYGVQNGQNSDIDITEIISTAQPQLDQFDLNPNFTYDSQAFFTNFSQPKE